MSKFQRLLVFLKPANNKMFLSINENIGLLFTVKILNYSMQMRIRPCNTSLYHVFQDINHLVPRVKF